MKSAAFTRISALGVENQSAYVLSDLTDPPEAAKTLGDRFPLEVRVAVSIRTDVSPKFSPA